MLLPVLLAGLSSGSSGCDRLPLDKARITRITPLGVPAGRLTENNDTPYLWCKACLEPDDASFRIGMRLNWDWKERCVNFT